MAYEDPSALKPEDHFFIITYGILIMRSVY